MMDEDWSVLMSFFPPQWKELAKKTNALKGLRRDKAPGKLLRILMVHLACGYSLRETVVRARQAQLAELSDVALLKRLPQVQGLALFAVRGIVSRAWPGFGGGGATGVSSDRCDDGEGTREDGQLVACAL